MSLSRERFTVRRMMVAVTFMPLLVAGCGGDEYRTPDAVFEATFNSTPGPSVSILEANGRAWGDNSTCYLRFKASPAAFSALTAVGFTPITGMEYRERIQSGRIVGPLPQWWNPLGDTPTVFFCSGSFHSNYREGQAIVAYDPKLEIANFYWDGND